MKAAWTAHFVAHGNQQARTAFLLGVRELSRHHGGFCAFALGVGENVNLGIAGFADEIARFLKLGFRFAGEASQYIRCERCHRVDGAQVFHRLPPGG